MHKLSSIQQQIHHYEQAFKRPAHSVKLLAVSKGRTATEIEQLYTAGQRAFGESYVQEALSKINALMDKEIEWHFIGPIQSNKTRKIAEYFSWAESIASFRIAKRLNDQRPTDLPPLNICLEVNIDNEPTKSGVATSQVLALAQQCLALPRLRLRGLMTIPAITTDFEQQRQTFKKCFLLWQQLQVQGIPLDTLSMGMSDDFQAAIAEGSTLIRLGRALF